MATDAAGNVGEDHLLVTVLPPKATDGGRGLPWALALVRVIVAIAGCGIVAFVIKGRKTK